MRYVITSRLGALGASPGEYVERYLSPEQERRLIGAGHIAPAPKRKNRPRQAVVLVKEESAEMPFTFTGTGAGAIEPSSMVEGGGGD